MGWIQTEVRFPNRARVFTIDRQSAIESGFDTQALAELRDMDADRLELFMRAFVVTIRPELANCQLVYMNFDYPRWRWEIGVSHPSLPVVAPCDMMEREPLFREAAASTPPRP